MTRLISIKAAALILALTSAAGTATPAAAQSSPAADTVRERVVVTLPNGRRVVRWVEKKAEPKAPQKQAGQPASSSDPFMNQLGQQFQQNAGNVPEALMQWYEFYLANDSRADVNDDGRIDGSDYFAVVSEFTQTGGWSPASDDGANDGEDNAEDTDENAGGDQPGDDGTNDDDNSDDDDSEWDAGNNKVVDGWTQFTASPDTVKIHVSADGDDNNNGRTPETAVRTIERGKALLRDGRPDWLLIRRGDTFNEGIGAWKKSGRSESEPMVVKTYGEGPRPRLIVPDRGVSMVNHRERREHLAFVGLHFEGAQPGVGNGFV
ncbi:MAG: hypothetical protein AAGF47_03115, partial [Planctomycetota bacterium]